MQLIVFYDHPCLFSTCCMRLTEIISNRTYMWKPIHGFSQESYSKTILTAEFYNNIDDSSEKIEASDY
jgi:hypothetical protein